MLILIFSYLFGSIPFGLILGYIFTGADIRVKGSGNIGTTNAFRVFGKAIGALTLLFDVAKGLIPVLLAKYLFHENASMQYSCALLAFIGHIFPIWLRFRGGKGVATALGAIMALDYQLMVIAALIWLLTFASTRIVSLSSIMASVALMVTSWFHHSYWGLWPQIFVIDTICLLIIIRHKDNIKRILNKTEKRIF